MGTFPLKSLIVTSSLNKSNWFFLLADEVPIIEFLAKSKSLDLSTDFKLIKSVSAGSSLFGTAAIQSPFGCSVSRSFRE